MSAKVFSIMFLAVFVSLPAFAWGGSPAAAAGTDATDFRLSPQGLICEPVVRDRSQLMAQLRTQRSALMHYVRKLSDALEETRFTSKDAVLTAIMPGGLLYAAYRKNQSTQAQAQLAQARVRLDELEDDLDVLAGFAAPTVVATAR